MPLICLELIFLIFFFFGERFNGFKDEFYQERCEASREDAQVQSQHLICTGFKVSTSAYFLVWMSTLLFYRERVGVYCYPLKDRKSVV